MKWIDNRGPDFWFKASLFPLAISFVAIAISLVSLFTTKKVECLPPANAVQGASP